MKIIELVLEQGIGASISLLLLAIAYKVYKSRCHERFNTKNCSFEISTAESPIGDSRL